MLINITSNNVRPDRLMNRSHVCIRSLPRITDPYVQYCPGRQIPFIVHHVLRQVTLLGLVLVLMSCCVSSAQKRSKDHCGPRETLTCRTKTLNWVFSPDPSLSAAAWTSFWSSLTAYSSVVRVSSTSSTIKTFLPTRLAISSDDRSSHCVRVTLVPGVSTGLDGFEEGNCS